MANLKSNVKVTKVKNLWVIDPNGEDSTAANLEDLNISVELEVLVRGDDPIIYSKNNINATNPTSNEVTRISFIDGSGNEEKYLTTHYTELNTKFNRDNKDLGTLGIETIDISFNTSYVPIVKIKFKDIRGQLFELGEESPYSFLFKMPYPIFYLTVKGYYGKPVQYALHMTKFNGNLDNETGSFIITCDFIGYTYAFLSDLLMGILKGTPYTQKGINAIKSIQGFTTFEELRSIVKKLEDYIIKFREDNKQLKALTIYDKLNTKLLSIEQSLTNVFPLIFEGYTKLTDTGVTTAQNMAVAMNTNVNYFTNNPDYLKPYTLSDTTKKEYKNSTLKLVEEYNELNQVKGDSKTFKLNIEDFQLDSNGIFYNNFKVADFIRKNEFNIATTSFYSFDEFQKSKDIKKYLNFKIKEQNDTFIKEMYGYTLDIINKKYRDNNLITDPSIKNMVDIRFALNKVRLTREKLQEEFDKNKKLVTESFTQDINSFLKKEGTKFDASIGSLFKILCDHVDLFIDVVKNLEEEIENDRKNGNRNLQAADKRNFTEFISINGSNQIAVAPFPEYVEDEGKDTNGDGTLVEKWLGSKRKFSEYAEVKFINDLYDSIKMAAKKDKEIIEGIYADSKAWFPINPLETLAFDENNENPWNSVIHSNIQPAMKLIVQRMALFLGFSHKNLTIEEITEVAKIEANQAYNTLIDVKNVIIEPNGNIDTQIKTYFGDSQETFGKVGTFHGLRLYYNKSFLGGDKIVYHHDKPDIGNGGFKNFNDAFNNRPEFIPINQTTKSLDSKFNELNTNTGRSYFNGTFISNVISNSQLNEGTNNEIEYEKFIKIIDKSDYTKQLIYESYVTGGDGNGVVSEMAENELVSTHNTLLGGRYRTHEFMTYKTPKSESPLFYEFYDIRLKENLISRAGDEGKNFIFNSNFKSNKKIYNLFGSRFYYNQTDNYSKALLFLHSIPFEGLLYKNSYEILPLGLLSNKTLKYFNERAGFTSIPYSWILFMGGLLFRNSKSSDILKYSITKIGDESLIPNINNVEINKDEYLIYSSISSTPINFNTVSIGSTKYEQLSDVIKNLPNSVKDIFINEFINWVDSENGWLNIQNNLEIFDDTTSDDQIITIWDNLKVNPNDTTGFKTNVSTNYKVIPNNEKGYFDLEIITASPASNDTFLFLIDEKVLINGTYRIWEGKTDRISNFEIPSIQQKEYLSTFFSTYKTLNATSTNPDAEINKNLFGTDKVDDIKLGLYKNIKSIYNKWILGVHPSMESIITGNLYKNFNFLDRAYIDISGKFKVSPTGFVDYLSSNSNISFYNFIARILRDNNFDFIPLPTFIDYSSKESVTSIFEPYNFNDSVTATNPQFICMYFGEQSNQLNIDKKNTKRPNDSFSLPSKYDPKTGELIITDTELPTDFKDGGQNIPYFLVNYVDQNQSIFKEIHLDQSEFTETNESLEIIDSLSKLNRNNSIGQNLFDIYNNRAYSVEVEMLGCAQIQPFMLFQINNVPIFDGAYTIINTRHHIKANHMTTTFKGVRIRRIKTKMVDDETLYAHLLANLDEVDSKGASLSDLSNVGSNTNYIFTKPTTAELNQNQVAVKQYFKDRGYNKEIVAGIMGNMEIESSFNLSAVNSRDTNELVSIGLIQWNFGSYPDVFQLYSSGIFSTVEQQLDYLTKMETWDKFIKEVNIITPPVTYYDEQYVAFLFAHYVEVCCGCARTKGYNTLNEIYSGPYTKGWGCPQDDPNATIFFPHKRSQAASYFMKRFNNPKDALYWKEPTVEINHGFISSI